ncbi:MAG: tRNA preQ1(34) S-adenosylmethionine ribosyltransferase-isomerase QueA [Eubacteriales bacterium]|nr:tRNA preQ1(34) S-adenosylmethionine ribosyltransferase-isomerase QueA [Eubacteriales bacterium]
MPPKPQVTTDQDLLLHAYNYDLPEELIAQDPLEQRDQSRMLVLQKHQPSVHQHIWDILDYLKPEDCLVINQSRVIPARLYGQVPGQESKIEVLLIRQLAEKTWRCLAKPGKKLKLGRRLVFQPGLLEAEVEAIEEDGSRILHFTYEGIWEEVLAQLGEMPLPPYIHHKLQDPDRYQTVYANRDGSVAAPTAGLHFTPDLLAAIQARGTAIAGIHLHVGIGTFRPVKEDHILDHQMHSEVYEVSAEAADLINRRKQAGGRIICVGTTSCRTLESLADPESGLLKAGMGETSLYIYPGYRFKLMDGLLTNFHLPESSLLMLVSAFYGREDILAAYREAVAERYRFYSLGDCMLILPELS